MLYTKQLKTLSAESFKLLSSTLSTNDCKIRGQKVQVEGISTLQAEMVDIEIHLGNGQRCEYRKGMV